MGGEAKPENDCQSSWFIPCVPVLSMQAVDDGIYWHVNYDRFQQYFRDQVYLSLCLSVCMYLVLIVCQTQYIIWVFV